MTDYRIHTDEKYAPLEPIDVGALADACRDPWWNQTLCRVNDCVVRLGVFHGEFHWHQHDREDELFYVVEGTLLVDLQDRTVALGPRQGIMVRRRRRQLGGGVFPAEDLAVRGNYVYTAFWDADGRWTLLVVDAPRPDRPVAAASLPGDLDVGRGNWLGDSPGALAIVDLGDPARPRERYRLLFDYSAYAIELAGQHAYVVTGPLLRGATGALRIVDVSDPDMPREIASVPVDGLAVGLGLAGGYAFVSVVDIASDWDYGPYEGGRIEVVSIADPARPKPVGRLALGSYGVSAEMALVNGVLWMPTEHAGLWGWSTSTSATAVRRSSSCALPISTSTTSAGLTTARASGSPTNQESRGSCWCDSGAGMLFTADRYSSPGPPTLAAATRHPSPPSSRAANARSAGDNATAGGLP